MTTLAGTLQRAIARCYPCLALTDETLPVARRSALVRLDAPHWYTFTQKINYTTRINRRTLRDNVRQANNLMKKLEARRMLKTTLIIAIVLTAAVAGAQDRSTFLAFKTTPTPEPVVVVPQTTYVGPGFAFVAPAPTAPIGQPQAYFDNMRQQQRVDDIMLQQRMQHTAEQSTLFYLSGGKVLE